MGEWNVNRVVFQIVDVVARADVGFRPEIIFLEVGIARQGRRVAFAEVDEDQAEVFLGRAAANANLLGEGFFLRRLLDALAGLIELPTVKAATNPVALDPADGELRLAVRAAKIDDMRLAAVAAIERKLFAENLDRLGPARQQILRAKNRMPEFSHITACQLYRDRCSRNP